MLLLVWRVDLKQEQVCRSIAASVSPRYRANVLLELIHLFGLQLFPGADNDDYCHRFSTTFCLSRVLVTPPTHPSHPLTCSTLRVELLGPEWVLFQSRTSAADTFLPVSPISCPFTQFHLNLVPIPFKKVQLFLCHVTGLPILQGLVYYSHCFGFFCLFFLLIECLYGMLLSFHLFIFPDFLYILYICQLQDLKNALWPLRLCQPGKESWEKKEGQGV